MTHIVSQIRKVEQCSADEREQLYDLLCQGFLGISWEDFIRDFQEKEAVILLRKEQSVGEIVGFSTLMLLTLTITSSEPAGSLGEALRDPAGSEEVMAIFSGDTMVLPEYRSSTGLGVELGRHFMNTYAQFPHHRVYYILMSKGWRTYKILPFFFKEFFPHHEKPTPACEQAVIEAFGRAKYPRQYQPETGLITFGEQAARLRPESIDAIPQKLDQHTQFFLHRNPGYLCGDELVCVASVSPENATSILQRLTPFQAVS